MSDSDQAEITFSLAMVREFLKTASEEAREMVRNMGCVEDPHGGPDRENDAVLCWVSAGHSGAGLYVYCGEYPEDGSGFVPFQLEQALRLQRATLLEEWLCEECGSLNKGADEACRRERSCSGLRPELPGVRWHETDAGFKYPPPECESCESCRACPLYRCSRCQKDRPWCIGAHDEHPDWCDECVHVHGYPGEEGAVPSVELGGDTEPLPMPSFDRVTGRRRRDLVSVLDSKDGRQSATKGSRMKLTRVTITGADDSTDIDEMIRLSRVFPFVEWGILVSKNQEASPRFPSRSWIDRYVSAVAASQIPINTSSHLCGLWVRKLAVGLLHWSEVPSCVSISQRVQINTHAELHSATHAMVDCLKAAPGPRKEFIFQWDEVNIGMPFIALGRSEFSTSILFDTSGGAGVLPERWPAAGPIPCGYAGGLGPDNVVAQLELIAKAAGDRPFWIDMERRVRTEDDSALDMERVRRVLFLTEQAIDEER